MAETTVDIVADLSKAAKAGKDSAAAFGGAFRAELKKQLAGMSFDALKLAAAKGGTVAAGGGGGPAAEAADDRKVRKQKAARTDEINDATKLLKIKKDWQGLVDGDNRRAKAAIAEEQRGRRAAGQAFMDKRDGILPAPSSWVGTDQQWRGMERQRIRQAQQARMDISQRRYATAKFGGGLAVGALSGVFAFGATEAATSYNAFKAYRDELGGAIGPISGADLIKNNEISDAAGNQFNVSRGRRASMQRMLAREIGASGVGAGVRDLIHLGAGKSGISAEQGAEFAGQLRQRTGAQGWDNIRGDMTTLFKTAERAGIGNGQFAKAFDPILKTADALRSLHGGKVSTGTVDAALGAHLGKGFSAGRALSIGGDLAQGFAATGMDPGTLHMFGAQKYGATGAFIRSQLSTTKSRAEAIATAKASSPDPHTQALRLAAAVKVPYGEAMRLLGYMGGGGGGAGNIAAGMFDNIDQTSGMGAVDPKYSAELRQKREDAAAGFARPLESGLNWARDKARGILAAFTGSDYTPYTPPAGHDPSKPRTARQIEDAQKALARSLKEIADSRAKAYAIATDKRLDRRDRIDATEAVLKTDADEASIRSRLRRNRLTQHMVERNMASLKGSTATPEMEAASMAAEGALSPEQRAMEDKKLDALLGIKRAVTKQVWRQ